MPSCLGSHDSGECISNCPFDQNSQTWRWKRDQYSLPSDRYCRRKHSSLRTHHGFSAAPPYLSPSQAYDEALTFVGYPGALGSVCWPSSIPRLETLQRTYQGVAKCSTRTFAIQKGIKGFTNTHLVKLLVVELLDSGWRWLKRDRSVGHLPSI